MNLSVTNVIQYIQLAYDINNTDLKSEMVLFVCEKVQRSPDEIEGFSSLDMCVQNDLLKMMFLSERKNNRLMTEQLTYMNLMEEHSEEWASGEWVDC